MPFNTVNIDLPKILDSLREDGFNIHDIALKTRRPFVNAILGLEDYARMDVNLKNPDNATLNVALKNSFFLESYAEEILISSNAFLTLKDVILPPFIISYRESCDYGVYTPQRSDFLKGYFLNRPVNFLENLLPTETLVKTIRSPESSVIEEPFSSISY